MGMDIRGVLEALFEPKDEVIGIQFFEYEWKAFIKILHIHLDPNLFNLHSTLTINLMSTFYRILREEESYLELGSNLVNK